MKPFAIAALATLAVAAPASAAVTLKSVSHFVTVGAQAESGFDATTFDFYSSTTVPVGTIEVADNFSVETTLGYGSATAQASIAFTTAASGNFTIGERTVTAGVFDGQTGYASSSALGQFDYTFTIDRASRIHVDTMIGAADGLINNRYTLRFYRGSTVDNFDVFQGQMSFTSAVLQPGQYKIGVVNSIRARQNGPGFDAKSADPASFDFNIAAVPEPAQWAMMIAGFGLAGAASRRRRRTIIAA